MITIIPERQRFYRHHRRQTRHADRKIDFGDDITGKIRVPPVKAFYGQAISHDLSGHTDIRRSEKDPGKTDQQKDKQGMQKARNLC